VRRLSARKITSTLHLTGLPALLVAAAPQTATAQVAPVRLEPVTRIGCLECSGPEMFTNIRDIDVGGGLIHVLDIGAPPYVRVFDATGASIRAFGRTGDGPGELRTPLVIHRLARGDIEVYDMQQRRLTRFDSAGSQTGTRRLEAGFFVLLARAPRDDALYYTWLDPRDTERPVRRLDEGTDAAQPFTVLRDDFPIRQPGPIITMPVLAARPAGGLAVGDGHTEYRIRLFDPTGAVTRDIVRDIPRQRKTKAELETDAARRDRMSRELARAMPRRGSRPPPPAPPVDEHRRHFTTFEYDDHGRLWVHTARGDRGETIFDVFDPAGRYLGELKLPHRLDAFAVGSGLLAGRVYDQDRIQYVAVWRVR
jgi:YD repeat-containing protein